MTCAPFLASRLIKLLGHTCKVLCYGFHALFPKMRFTIPAHSKALWPTQSPSQVPRIIWQTNFTNRVTLPVYLNYLFNRLMSPRHEYRFMITEARLDFIKQHCPDPILKAYQRLTVGASQADLWRLLVLQKHGGIYMDIDAHLVWPLSRIVSPHINALYLKVRENHYSNYFIASAPNNPDINAIIQIILDNIYQDSSAKGVYGLTGPGAMNEILLKKSVPHRLYRYTCIQGSFTNEHFQYIDKPKGKWIHIDKKDILKKN